MKKLVIIVLIICLACAITANINNNLRIIISNLLKKQNIRDGQLHYRFYLFGFLPVGNAIFDAAKLETYKGQNVFHLSVAADSLKIFAKFFSGSVTLDSYIDSQKYYPILYKEKISLSGKPDINKEVIYDQENGVMSIAGIKRTISPNTQDSLSAIFNFRRMNFNNISVFEFSLNTNQKNYILTGAAEPKDLLIGKKTFKAILLKAEISRKDKNPYHKSKIEMILLKEANNVPILIKAFANGILVNAKLVDIK